MDDTNMMPPFFRFSFLDQTHGSTTWARGNSHAVIQPLALDHLQQTRRYLQTGVID